MALFDDEDSHALLARVRCGDAGAWDDLVDLHWDRLERLAKLRLDPRLRSRFGPEDLVQEALTDAFTTLESYMEAQGRVTFSLWLSQRLLERISRAHRDNIETQKRSILKERVTPSGPSDSRYDWADGLIAPGSSPSHNLTRLEACRLVRVALGELPVIDREVLLLFSIERRGHEEIGNLLGISTAAAKAHHHRASCRLALHLRRTYPDWLDAAYPKAREIA